MGMCTQNLNFVGTQICGHSKFVGAQNLLILKICGTKICGYYKFVGTQKKFFVGTQICWYSY